MNVVVVESPAKAKTINKYLGKDFNVLASYGHVRDLPPKDGSVRPDEDFSMSWQVDERGEKRLREIAAAVKKSKHLYLATDPDREGEAISWHIVDELKRRNALNGVDVERVVFNEITKKAVLEAFKHPRRLNQELIDAYMARRALDYLVGFTLSPVLWRKLPGARSAGRVQSVALRLICDRELEIEKFRPQEYWTVEADLKAPSGEPFKARLASIDGKRLDKFDIANAEEAGRIRAGIGAGPLTVDNIESKPQKRHPQPPFTTSTLQQEASRKLGFGSAKTMRIAQRLYEGVDIGGETVGLITYMRTDGVQITPEAVAACRNVIAERFGAAYVPGAPRNYRTRAKNAQEAHEAIRPTDLARAPEAVRAYLDDDQFRLYSLVWQRAIASQMESAEIERTTADLSTAGTDGRNYSFRATGSVVRFDGFLKLYQEGRDDEEDEEARRLPPLARADRVGVDRIETAQHFTEPPPRFTEATLIKRMEELGIGRPSTYTAILSVLQERGYVRMEKKRLHPEDKGRLVTAFLEAFFRRYVEYDFTANLEDQLDRISNGEINWKDVLRDFWEDFSAAVAEISDLRISEVLEALNELLGPHIFPDPGDGSDPRKCPACDDGRLSLKISRYGAFIGCSNYPECRYTRPIGNGSEQGQAATTGADGAVVLGIDPETGLEVSLLQGRFGPYVQRAAESEDEKPKRASLPKGMDPQTVDLEKALDLLSLPREVGIHPETGKPITAAIGRFGPYVHHDGVYANITADEVFTVGLNRAVSLLAEKQQSRGRSGPSVIKDLGEHPELGGPVQVLSGRYGPYVKHGKVNATLPRDSEPEAVTIEQAVELIAAKAASPTKGKKRGGARKAAAAR